MKYVRMLLRVFTISLQRALSHRANLVFELLMTAAGIAASGAAVGALYSHVDDLAGWRLGETIVLLGMFYVVNGLLGAFVEPNLEWFAGKVNRGELDDLLLQPVPSLFMASFGTCQPLALINTVLGCGVIAFGVRELGSVPGPGQWAGCLLLLSAGVLIAWAARVLLASLAFWAPGLEPEVMYFAFWQLGRYPVAVYHPAVRWLLTYVLPVAFIATLPAQALGRGASMALLVTGLLAAIGAFVGARLVWRAGLARYTSATS